VSLVPLSPLHTSSLVLFCFTTEFEKSAEQRENLRCLRLLSAMRHHRLSPMTR